MENEGIYPEYMSPFENEMVDIGVVADSMVETFDYKSCFSCDGKGFFRPSYLHISPAGGVRTCLYAPNSEWLGNINNQTLSQVASDFADNCVVGAFRSNTIVQLREKYIAPYFAKAYRMPKHPCANSAVIARIIEELNIFRKQQGRKPTSKDLRTIHENIANDYNLLGKSSVGSREP